MMASNRGLCNNHWLVQLQSSMKLGQQLVPSFIGNYALASSHEGQGIPSKECNSILRYLPTEYEDNRGSRAEVVELHTQVDFPILV